MKGGELMSRWAVTIKDRQTGKKTTVYIEARTPSEARAIAIERYGISHEVL